MIWYVGKKLSGRYEAFGSAHKPTDASHGARYSTAQGPFRTRREAENWAETWNTGPATERDKTMKRRKKGRKKSLKFERCVKSVKHARKKRGTRVNPWAVCHKSLGKRAFVGRSPERGQRLFIGVFPTGFSYADRYREEHGDYARCAFLDFATLTLEWSKGCPKELARQIRAHARKIIARAGQSYVVSSSGQTVILGSKMKSMPAGSSMMRRDPSRGRKTFDEYEVQGNYGYGHGFEVVTTEENWSEARKRLKEYRENEPGVPFRIKHKRHRIQLRLPGIRDPRRSPMSKSHRYRKIWFSRGSERTAGIVVTDDWIHQQGSHLISGASRLFPMHEARKMKKFHASPAFSTWEEAFAFDTSKGGASATRTGASASTGRPRRDPRGALVNRPRRTRRSPISFEQNEVSLFHAEMRRIEKAPLADRKEGAKEFAAAMANDPALVAERVGWLLDGNYGQGSYIKANEVARNKRMNRVAWLSQVVGALEWQSPFRMTAAAWNKLTPEQKRRLNTAVLHALEAHLQGG